MRIGSTLALFYCYENERYKKMKEFGFYGVDFGIDGELRGRSEEQYEADIMAEKALMDEAGIVPYQVHGPFRYPIHDETEELRAGRAEVMKRSLRCTALIGCKNWVIHPMMPFGEDEFDHEQFIKINVDFFRALLPTAKQYGITICLENMPMLRIPLSKPEKTLEFVRMMDDENFKFCLDTGHAAVFGLSPAEAVRMAGKDLKAIHVHDNNGKYDAHWVPCTGVIDWKDFVAALREIEYEGVFSLESDFRAFIPNAGNDGKLGALMSIVNDLLAN